MSATEPRDALGSLLLEFRAEVIDTCARAEGFMGGWRDSDWILQPVDLEAWSERFLRVRPIASEEAIEAAAREISEKSYQGSWQPETWAEILRRHFAR